MLLNVNHWPFCSRGASGIQLRDTSLTTILTVHTYTMVPELPYELIYAIFDVADPQLLLTLALTSRDWSQKARSLSFHTILVPVNKIEALCLVMSSSFQTLSKHVSSVAITSIRDPVDEAYNWVQASDIMSLLHLLPVCQDLTLDSVEWSVTAYPHPPNDASRVPLRKLVLTDVSFQNCEMSPETRDEDENSHLNLISTFLNQFSSIDVLHFGSISFSWFMDSEDGEYFDGADGRFAQYSDDDENEDGGELPGMHDTDVDHDAEEQQQELPQQNHEQPRLPLASWYSDPKNLELCGPPAAFMPVNDPTPLRLPTHLSLRELHVESDLYESTLQVFKKSVPLWESRPEVLTLVMPQSYIASRRILEVFARSLKRLQLEGLSEFRNIPYMEGKLFRSRFRSLHDQHRS